MIIIVKIIIQKFFISIFAVLMLIWYLKNIFWKIWIIVLNKFNFYSLIIGNLIVKIPLELKIALELSVSILSGNTQVLENAPQ